MSPVKSARLNNTKKPRVAPEDDTSEEGSAHEPAITKPGKKPFDFEAEEAVSGIPAVDKLAEDGLPVESVATDEETEEEAGLDDEELNPFGDKWEE